MQYWIQFSSVTQLCLMLCDPMDCSTPDSCPSPTPGVHSNSCSLSWWCHPTMSSSVVPFSSCLQSFPASESFQMSQLFASGGQSIGVSASTSVLPMNTQNWSIRYDLNQIPYDYTVEVTNRFKRLDLIEWLMNYGWRFVTLQESGIKTIPRKVNAKKQNGCLRRPYK